MTGAALYTGKVTHARVRPFSHKLAYRVFMGVFDIDDFAALAKRTWAFAYNRPGLIAFYDRDHGDGSGKALRPQIEAALSAINIDIPGGAIQLLCMPRVLGYVFNPLSVYFCHDKDGNLAAIVHEVHNTYGERHIYALPVEAPVSGGVTQTCSKEFRVSPFLPMNLHYTFNITSPGERVSVSILVSGDEGPVLTAAFAGARRAFTNASIVRLWLSHPLLTLKVIAGIHWEAVHIWLKGRKAAAQLARLTSQSAQ